MSLWTEKFFAGKKVLVAGVAGCMGSTALSQLTKIHDVQVDGIFHCTEPRLRPCNVNFVQADLTDMVQCERVIRGMDVVFMFAGIPSTTPVLTKDPVDHIRKNLIINEQMLQAAHQAGVQKYIWLSSSTGYPELNRDLVEEDMFTGDPDGVHFHVGWMNRYSEIMCRTFAEKIDNPMTVVVFRPTTIYGEYQSFDASKSHVLPAMVRKLACHENPIEIWGDGKNVRDWIHAEDVFEACLLGLEKIEGFDVFNIGFGREYSINDLVNMLIRVDGLKSVKMIHTGGKLQSVHRRVLDLGKSKQKLGFNAKIDLDTGVKRMLRFFRKSQP